MKNNSFLGRLRDELKKNIDEDTKNTAQRFFKEKIKCYGIKTSLVTLISKKFFEEIKDEDKSEIFGLCEKLFQTRYMEESFVACNWAYGLREKFEEKDLATFKRWLENYVYNWASCDMLCNHTICAFIEKFPKHVTVLKKWAKSKNIWVRRAAAVTLIVPAKKGKFLKEAFEISDRLMSDKEDLVQKGYGWLLKEESKTCQKQVFDYVLKNKHKMPRTALRYAIERMPDSLRRKAMEK